MRRLEPLKFSEFELEYLRPSITKVMRGLSPHDKSEVLRLCMKDYAQKRRYEKSRIKAFIVN